MVTNEVEFGNDYSKKSEINEKDGKVTDMNIKINSPKIEIDSKITLFFKECFLPM